jgi:hypothetical protein
MGVFSLDDGIGAVMIFGLGLGSFGAIGYDLATVERRFSEETARIVKWSDKTVAALPTVPEPLQPGELITGVSLALKDTLR